MAENRAGSLRRLGANWIAPVAKTGTRETLRLAAGSHA